ncbi:18679_t:CDS:1 [Acaulospora morrowiae]|uniref:Protein YOP1 n=1 Tax=Acaulospora morrowiae TaxID=94023 RepID=A0A9N9A4Q6_9GLOM|nr:18679_t:CDS:1 [Acaulospora morrowiae]
MDSFSTGSDVEDTNDTRLNYKNLPTTAFLEQVLLYIETNSPLNLTSITELIRKEMVMRVASIEDRCSKVWLFSKLVKLGIPSFYLFIALFLSASMTVRHMYKHSVYLLCNLLGVVYPAYRSIKAIESQNSDDTDATVEQRQWLTYWVVYGWLQVADYWSSWLLRVIPGYNFFKLIFLYWAQNDNSRGATIIFERILKPLLRKPSKKIDKTRKMKQSTRQRQQHDQFAREITENSSVHSSSIPYRPPIPLETIWGRDPETRETEVKPYRLNNV